MDATGATPPPARSLGDQRKRSDPPGSRRVWRASRASRTWRHCRPCSPSAGRRAAGRRPHVSAFAGWPGAARTRSLAPPSLDAEPNPGPVRRQETAGAGARWSARRAGPTGLLQPGADPRRPATPRSSRICRACYQAPAAAGRSPAAPQRPFTRPVPDVPIAAQLSHKRQRSTGRSRPACTQLPVRDRCARTGSSVPPGRSELVTYRQRILGRENVDSASGPAYTVLWRCGRRVGAWVPA
jgi:hypothetical protein